MLSPQCVSYLRPALGADLFGCVGFDRADQHGNGHSWRVINQQVQVVGFSVGLHKRDAMSFADLPSGPNQQLLDSVGDGIASIFSQQNNVGVQGVDHVSSSTVIV